MTAALIEKVEVCLPNATIELQAVTPRGGNPRFFALEVERQLTDIAHRVRRIIEAEYPGQEP